MSYARHMETHKTPLHKLRAGTDRLPERKRAGKTAMRPLRQTRTMTRKELFEELYQKHLNKPRRMKIEAITKEMLPYFKTEELSRNYVIENIER